MSEFENKNKEMDCFVTMKRWLENRNSGKSFVDYFDECGYKNIAIYGAGDLGSLLYEELKNTDIVVSYFVDRNAEALGSIDGIPVILLKDVKQQKKVDVIVVTPAGNYDSICRDLVKNVPDICTLSLKDAVYEI